MRKSRFTEEQIIGVLREHEAGATTAEVCCRLRGRRAVLGPPLPVLAIVDDLTREALALVVDTSIGGHRVVRELDP